MYILIAALGVAIAAFGIVVLIRYHDRPGGTLKWLGLEISSAGAGLPLVAIGVLSVIAATTFAPDPADKGTSDRNGAMPGRGAPDSAISDARRQQSLRDTSQTEVDTTDRNVAITETNDDHKVLGSNTKPMSSRRVNELSVVNRYQGSVRVTISGKAFDLGGGQDTVIPLTSDSVVLSVWSCGWEPPTPCQQISRFARRGETWEVQPTIPEPRTVLSRIR
jgi:hypothetical protein